MEVQLLEKIAKNTDHKTSFQIIVSSNKTSFNTRFTPPLQLEKDKEYEVALVNLETYYSFPNIDSRNNTLVYSPDNGALWEKIKIPEGSYDLVDINDFIHFFPNVSPGYKIIENPVNLVYLPLTSDKIDNLNVSITDQDGNSLNLRVENLTIRLHMREAR